MPKPITRRHHLQSLSALAAAGALPGLALAQAPAWPTKPVKFVVPLTAGSGADIVARALAKRLQDTWSQGVVIENRPGAGGQIGTQAVVNAPADGYTLLVQSASHAANPAIYKQLPYDATRDLIDVALLATSPYVMVTASTGPYASVRALIDAAKAKPGELAYASAGIGSSTHLTAELFVQRAGLKMVHVPFKGSPDAVTDVASGRTAFYMAPVSTVAGMLREGRIKPIALTADKRSTNLPEVPTLAESGLANFQAALWFGLWAPAATPPAVIAKLAADVRAATDSPDVRDQYRRLGNEVNWLAGADFAKFVRDEIEVNRQLVRAAGIEQQ